MANILTMLCQWLTIRICWLCPPSYQLVLFPHVHPALGVCLQAIDTYYQPKPVPEYSLHITTKKKGTANP